eukprot:TRINITY_DN1853_c1_g1_i7.p1 TRINITY_DN1853_c1_g1~~TRINITY_DN1853_c1_g1_i7.p1  ORF type:complete len:393 (+),score=125.73 TRINITY_DN1853_c1_g1_i7:422-1600(+)
MTAHIGRPDELSVASASSSLQDSIMFTQFQQRKQHQQDTRLLDENDQKSLKRPVSFPASVPMSDDLSNKELHLLNNLKNSGNCVPEATTETSNTKSNNGGSLMPSVFGFGKSHLADRNAISMSALEEDEHSINIDDAPVSDMEWLSCLSINTTGNDHKRGFAMEIDTTFQDNHEVVSSPSILAEDNTSQPIWRMNRREMKNQTSNANSVGDDASQGFQFGTASIASQSSSSKGSKDSRRGSFRSRVLATSSFTAFDDKILMKEESSGQSNSSNNSNEDNVPVPVPSWNSNSFRRPSVSDTMYLNTMVPTMNFKERLDASNSPSGANTVIVDGIHGGGRNLLHKMSPFGIIDGTTAQTLNQKTDETPNKNGTTSISESIADLLAPSNNAWEEQ